MPAKTNITLENIQELLDKQKTDIITEIKTDLNVKIKELEDIVEKSKKDITANSKSINDLTQRINTMELTLNKQKTLIDDQTKQIENQTNRSLRNTLILRNLPEETPEKTWDQTKEKLCELLGYHLDMDPRQANDMIERCHRSTGTKDDDKDKIRPIYIRFYSWNDAQFTLHTINKQRARDKRITFKIDQMYSSSLLDRRNKALIVRRNLLRDPENSIKQAYLAYPAKLMVKEENNTKFSFYKAF